MTSTRLLLQEHDLTVLQLDMPYLARALSGRHWLSVDGLDICLNSGQEAMVPAGKVLLEGDGELQLLIVSAAKPATMLRLRTIDHDPFPGHAKPC